MNYVERAKAFVLYEPERCLCFKIKMHKMRKCLLFALTLIVSGLVAGCCRDDDDDVTTESSINYTLTISPDLLKFVTPQLSYVDENGNLIKVTGVEELDGLVLENSAEISKNGSYAGAWSKTVISGTGYKCWTVKMKFNRLKFHSYMGVKYIRNEFVEDTEDKAYDFHHSINTSISSVTEGNDIGLKAYQDTYVSLSLMDFHRGDDLENYLNNLTQNPDKAGYYVDGDGNVTRRDEFNL